MGQEASHNHGINWYHIHNRGVEAVIVDMCAVIISRISLGITSSKALECF